MFKAIKSKMVARNFMFKSLKRITPYSDKELQTIVRKLKDLKVLRTEEKGKGFMGLCDEYWMK